ncbi:DUF1642 domain-containing protein [Enterococcus faecium]
MNKQELIDKYTAEIAKLRPYCPNRNSISEQLKYDLYKEILDDLEQLDEPQKSVVPQFVVDWFEEHKRNLDYSIWEYILEWDQQDRFSDFHQWFDKEPNNPIETLIRMKNGYEVEKEPLYRVKLGEGYFVEYQGRGALIIPDGNKEIKIFDSKSDAERTAQTIGGTVEEVVEG